MITIDSLTKTYHSRHGDTTVLDDVSLTVPDATITAVVGPSGAGKSTLGRCISLLEHPTSGSILLNGRDLSQLRGAELRRERRAIGTIFQSSALLSRRTAAENVALPLEYLGVVRHEIRDRVNHLLDRVGILDKADAYPAQLSGGQKQRVGIARALALKPQIVLSDEATSGLDPDATRSILALLRELRDELDLSIILITHEMDAVREGADAVASLQHGRIVESGSVRDLIADPDSPLGRRLVAVRPINAQQDDVAVEVSYGEGTRASNDWISELTLRLGIRIPLLGGILESTGDVRDADAAQLSGRVVVGIPAVHVDEAEGLLGRLGLRTRIVHPARAQGAVGRGNALDDLGELEEAVAS